jgi:exopolysaccharide biosynthesis polyprenyl glycosylphosphotransferase
MLIVGTNPRSIKFAKKIENNPHFGYKIVGFIDDKWHGVKELQKHDYQLKGEINDFLDFIRSNVIDEVVIGLPVKSRYDQITQIISLCEEQGINIRFLSNIFNHKLGHMSSDNFAGDNFILFYNGKLAGWPLLFKRIMDITFSFILLVFCLPLFLIISLLIKITSQGPAFFIQERVGLNKRRFNLYKFRTMVLDAEKLINKLEHLNEVDGPAFKIKNDPRVTAFGRFLRKTSLDELPQLINVLKGDMSIVGPRPLPVRDYEGFSHDWQRRRFSVRPGLTCLWQINGRSEVSFKKWMELDLKYIDGWSFWLDIIIIAKTIPVLISGRGAS